MRSESKWTRSRFDFTFPVELYPEILERLRGTPAAWRLDCARFRTTSCFGRKVITGQSKSMPEHLLDLEPLAMGRRDDFESGPAVLRPADMENSQTYKAHHNEKQPHPIPTTFRPDPQPNMHPLPASPDP